MFGGPLSYMGFGGAGLQVRDILHIDDLYDLLVRQLADIESCSARACYNVGGGLENSISVFELTTLCQEISGKRKEIGRIAETRNADIPYYVSDCSFVTNDTGWKPQRGLQTILTDVSRWLFDNRHMVETVLS
jgi:CDP-paratose 2-epimerase